MRGRKPEDLRQAIANVDEAHASMHRQRANMRRANKLVAVIFADGRVDERDRTALNMLRRCVLDEQTENLGVDVRLEEACVCLSEL